MHQRRSPARIFARVLTRTTTKEIDTMNTVAALRPNRPARYIYDGDHAVMLPEDEPEADALPADAITRVLAQLDPQRLADSAEEARAIAARKKQAKAELAKVLAEIADAKRRLDQLQGEAAVLERKMETERRNIGGEKQALAAEKLAVADERAALKADHMKWDKKIAAATAVLAAVD
jgi:hypothetical protein